MVTVLDLIEALMTLDPTARVHVDVDVVRDDVTISGDVVGVTTRGALHAWVDLA